MLTGPVWGVEAGVREASTHARSGGSSRALGKPRGLDFGRFLGVQWSRACRDSPLK